MIKIELSKLFLQRLAVLVIGGLVGIVVLSPSHSFASWGRPAWIPGGYYYGPGGASWGSCVPNWAPSWGYGYGPGGASWGPHYTPGTGTSAAADRASRGEARNCEPALLPKPNCPPARPPRIVQFPEWSGPRQQAFGEAIGVRDERLTVGDLVRNAAFYIASKSWTQNFKVQIWRTLPELVSSQARLSLELYEFQGSDGSIVFSHVGNGALEEVVLRPDGSVYSGVIPPERLWRLDDYPRVWRARYSGLRRLSED